MEIPPFPQTPNTYLWASYVKDRRPQFKLHKNRGQAFNAVMLVLHRHPRGGVIYFLNADNEWEVDFAYEQDLHCVQCGVEGDLPASIDQRKGIDNILTTTSQYRTVSVNGVVSRQRIPREETKMVHYGCKPAWEAKHP